MLNPSKKRAILLAKGWSSEDSKNYIPYVVDSTRLRYYVERSLNELVLFRYADINRKYTFNKSGKEIVYNIIASILNDHVHGIMRYFEGMKSYVLPFLNLRYEVKKQIQRYNNRFIAHEATKFENLLDRLLKPSAIVKSNSIEELTNVKEILLSGKSSPAVSEELLNIIERSAIAIKIDKSSLIELIINEVANEIAVLENKKPV